MFGLTRPRRTIAAALRWAPDLDEGGAVTVIDRRPFARAEDARIATEGPREVEEDPTPSSRPRALEAAGIGAIEVGHG